MITKFQLFEGYDKPHKFNLGQDVYYHGRLKANHGFYIVKYVYFDNEQDIWRYDLSDVKDLNRIMGVWESSLSLTEAEGKKNNAEFEKRQEEKRLQHLDLDPLGEEDWS